MKLIKLCVKKIQFILYNIFGLVRYLWDLFYYKVLFQLLESTPFRLFKYRPAVDNTKTLCILANGPSLLDVIPRTQNDKEFEGCDFSVMNFFANDPFYTVIKPKYYCLFDSMFDRADERYEKVMEMFKNMNELTTWPMILYTRVSEKSMRKYSELSNPNITIVPISSVGIRCSNTIKHWFYKHGFAMTPIGTVANVNVWTGLQNGYRHIRLYGVDMTFFEGLCVNNDNQVCSTMRHFYDKESKIVPIYNYAHKRVFHLSEFIDMVNSMIKGHEALSAYAEYLGVEVLNCCKVSMLDCYPREK